RARLQPSADANCRTSKVTGDGTCSGTSGSEADTAPVGIALLGGRLACGVEHLIFDLRSEAFSVYGKLDVLGENAASDRQPTATARDIVEASRRLGDEELVGCMEGVGAGALPGSVCRWHRRRGIEVRRLRQRAALIEHIHEFEAIHAD